MNITLRIPSNASLKSLLSSLFICCLAVILGACGKNEDDPAKTAPENNTAYLEMKVDGELWKADSEINAWSPEHILLTGKKANTVQAVSANVPYDKTTGTYPIEAETGSFFHFQQEAGALYQITEAGGHGTITITARKVNADGHTMLTGTFKGVAIRFGDTNDSIRIAEGRFHDVKLN